MGSCGCGDFAGEFKLKGPEGVTYVIERYPGCSHCDAPAGIVIYRLSGEILQSFSIGELPDLPFTEYGREEGGNGESAIPIFDKNALLKKVKPWLEGNWEEYFDPDDDGGQLSSLLEDGLDEVMHDVIRDSMGQHGLLGARKRTDHDKALDLLRRVRSWCKEEADASITLNQPDWVEDLVALVDRRPQ